MPEQGHDPVARVLVDRALETVHLGGDPLEAAIDEVVHDLGVELLGQRGEARHVSKEHRHLFALAFQGTAGGEDFLGQIGWGVSEGGSSKGLHGSRGGGGSRTSVTRPDQDVAPLIDRQALALDEFVLHILEGRVIELELPLEGPIGQAAPLAQQGNHLIHHRDKVHPRLLLA